MPTLSFLRGKSPLIGNSLAKRTQICLVLIFTVMAFGQTLDFSYQQRGPYKEGILYNAVDLFTGRPFGSVH